MGCSVVRKAVLGALLWISVGTAYAQSDPLALAARIDAVMEEQCSLHGIRRAPLSSDAEFVRRVHLDLIGCIPSAARARDFLADRNPAKRQALIEELLASPRHLTYATHTWRRWLMPGADSDSVVRQLSFEFEAWLRKQFANNVPYDQLVRQIIITPLPSSANSAYQFYSSRREPSPTGFYASNEVRPATAATLTARLFLGLRLDCAQCHDHPTGAWRQDQFWSYAAFFRELEPRDSGFFSFLAARPKGPPRLTIPNTKQTVAAAFLDGNQPEFTRPTRELLAEWITDSNNPYFARAAVNRIWSHYFGRGLVDPIDDLEQGEATHPELLQFLADYFRESGYDQKALLRGILNSRTYQLSSQMDDPRQLESRLYARSLPRKMNGFQIYESINQAGGAELGSSPSDYRSFRDITDRDRFIELAESGNEATIDRPTSLLEALTMMNGELVQAALDPEQGQFLRAMVAIPGLSDEQRISTVFLATLAREPTASEQTRLLEQLHLSVDSSERAALFSDLMWALLNSSEFAMNH